MRLNTTKTVQPSPYQNNVGESCIQVLDNLIDAVDTAAEPCTKVRPELTVVIPVYNEPLTVVDIVRRVAALPIRKEIIVVNDGSTDGTAQTLQRISSWSDVVVLTHDQNQGKGAALRTGFQRACGDIVVIQDADLEYDPQDILQVIEPLQRRLADAVYGSRYLETPLQDPSWIHRFGNGCLTKFSNWMTGQRLTDMETCYKAFRREVLQRIQIEQSRFGFEPEITAKLSRLGIKIKEVNVRYHSRSRKDGKKIGWRDAINAIACIIRYRRDNG